MKYYHLFLYLVLVVSCIPHTHAQIDSTTTSRNIVYAEVGGIGGFGSLNYERKIYTKSRLSLSVRSGLSTYQIKDFRNKLNPDILIPVAGIVSYGRKHKIEIALGQTITSIVQYDTQPKRSYALHTNYSIGYGYQKSAKGIFFRIAYTPVLEFNNDLKHWGGMSLGYAF